MNNRQKKLVMNWGIALVVVAILIGVTSDVLRWLIFIVAGIYFKVTGDNYQNAPPPWQLLQQSTLAKYLSVLFVLADLGIAVYALYNDINLLRLGLVPLLILCFMPILPTLVIAQIWIYNSLGEENTEVRG